MVDRQRPHNAERNRLLKTGDLAKGDDLISRHDTSIVTHKCSSTSIYCFNPFDLGNSSVAFSNASFLLSSSSNGYSSSILIKSHHSALLSIRHIAAKQKFIVWGMLQRIRNLRTCRQGQIKIEALCILQNLNCALRRVELRRSLETSCAARGRRNGTVPPPWERITLQSGCAHFVPLMIISIAVLVVSWG